MGLFWLTELGGGTMQLLPVPFNMLKGKELEKLVKLPTLTLPAPVQRPDGTRTVNEVGDVTFPLAVDLAPVRSKN